MARDIPAEQREIEAAVEGRTVCRTFQATIAAEADREAMRWKTADGWSGLTWKAYGERVRDLASGLAALGLAPGEFVNFLASNRAEYVIADLAVLHAAGTPVSLYNTLAPEQIEYIVNHCEGVFVFAENPATFRKFLAIRGRIPKVRKVILFEGADEVAAEGGDWVTSLEAVAEEGRAYARERPTAFDARWKSVEPTGLCTLIYTSGTTGPPKGVMVTQRNVCWTVESLNRVWAPAPGRRQISYLPLAHIAERMVGHYMHVTNATHVTFCPNPQEIAAYLAAVRPELFFAVPRIWEKLHSALTSGIAKAEESQKRAATEAIEASLAKLRLEQRGEPVPPDVAERAAAGATVTAAIRARLGLDALDLAFTGAAPISAEILEWFHAIGVPIAEIYGQSEGSGPTSWNRPGKIKIGTVGPAIPGVELRLADDGELLVRGGNVTGGYYKEPKLTAETFDAEGWLHSGDVATIDADGYVKIVDRKKEIIITAGGKNIAPSNIESLLKQKPLVGQACVIGDMRPYVSALIVLDADAARAFAAANGLPAGLAELARHPRVTAEVEGYVAEVNEHLANVERVKKFTILAEEWTADSGELTPTLKMKRKVVGQKYAEAIEGMYR